ncbi:MAG: amidohydrolase family protein [Thermoanaerobaculia bacterium]
MRRLSLLLLALALLAHVDGRGAELDAAAPPRYLVLAGATVYTAPGEPPIRDGVVLVGDGRIASVGTRGAIEIPNGADVLNCTGATVTAGFWNSHVHFIERKWAKAATIPAAELEEQLEAMLTRYGFTSVFDTGSMLENTLAIRERIESGDVAGPRIRSTGEVLYPPRGVPAPLILDIKGFMRVELPEIEGEEDARAAARKVLDGGADAVKLYAATWAPPIVALSEEAIRGAVAEAAERGKPVFAHPSNRDGLLAAVRGGVDVLVHTTPQSGRWDGAILRAMTEADVALIPTLKLWTYELRHDRLSRRESFTAVGIGQLREWVATGGLVLFGTDVGYMSDYDPSDEYALMAEAGMTFAQILASLTTAPARRFGDPDRLGRVAPGLVADLVVLEGDPAENVRKLADVRYTLRDGKVIYTRGSGAGEAH